MTLSKYPVRGYFHPESEFRTIDEWQVIARKILALQRKGFSTRGGTMSDNPELVDIVKTYYSYQLFIETSRYPLLTQKRVLDHIEDFCNHRVWGMKKEFRDFLPNIDTVKIAFFYSRGDIEPFVLLNGQFTQDIYGSKYIVVKTNHWCSEAGFENIQDSIKNHYTFGISTFTKGMSNFFDPNSNIELALEGYLVAAFNSDAKTIATTAGHRAANMYRLAYPNEKSNLVFDLENEEGEVETSIWDEVVIKPLKIISAKQITNNNKTI